jgi:hypothetical protein
LAVALSSEQAAALPGEAASLAETGGDHDARAAEIEQRGERRTRAKLVDHHTHSRPPGVRLTGDERHINVHHDARPLTRPLPFQADMRS